MRRDMSKKKVSGLILIALFVILAVSISVISYSIANKESSSKDFKSADKQLGAANEEADYITNIDCIIEDSYLTDAAGAATEESYYNVVEILPYSSETTGYESYGLETYIQTFDSTGKIATEDFKKYVIDEHKDFAERDMKSGHVRYSRINVKADTTLASVEAVLNKADLIYLSSPTLESYLGEYNIPEDIYNWLDNYATKSKKPIIMDYVSTKPADNTYGSLIWDISRNHIKYRTFFWDVKNFDNPVDFFNAKSKKKNDENNTSVSLYASFYLPFTVRDEPKPTGKVLVVSNGNHDLSDKLKPSDLGTTGGTTEATTEVATTEVATTETATTEGAATTEGTATTEAETSEAASTEAVTSETASSEDVTSEITTEEAASSEAPTTPTSNWTVEDFKNNAYFGNKSVIDNINIEFIYKSPSELTGANVPAKNDYDFIIIENDCMSTSLKGTGYDDFAAWQALSIQSQYIIYDKKYARNDDGDDIDSGLSNYYRLQNLLITNTEVARFSNVLPVRYGFFNISGDASRDTAKLVADLINWSDYRGNSTSGGNGRIFRVLELQPCYPIDLGLAEETTPDTGGYNSNALTRKNKDFKGDYYTNPEQMVYGLSEDEVDGKTQYYKFELSKAKIVEALGLHYGQIRLEQMSTEEFISDKRIPLETYDLIYIGGDHSALLPRNFMSTYGWTLQSGFLPTMVEDYMPIFNMYTHTGYPVKMQATESGGGSVKIGTNSRPYGAITDTTYTPLNGNDLTRLKYNELVDYMNAGMPIIFSDVVTKEYDKMKNQERLNQLLRHHLIDPDSNMYELLTQASNNKTADGYAIGWNFDASSKIEYDSSGQVLPRYSNAEHKYGMIAATVHLFSQKSVDQLNKIFDKSSRRPTLTITSKPKDYEEGKEETYNDNVDGTMKITATGKVTNGDDDADLNYALYVDRDGNGAFSPDEKVSEATAKSQGVVDLVYTFEDMQFFGIVNWKVVLTQGSAKGECDIANGYAYYKRTGDKKEVNVLQIMPRNKATSFPAGSPVGLEDGHGLYLCTECQQATYRAQYNIFTVSTGDPYLNTMGDYPYAESNTQNVEAGLHEHKFGIVKYLSDSAPRSTYDKVYANGLGAEDWDSNFADLLAEDYDFHLDIVYLDELAKYTKDVRVLDDDQRAANELALDTAKDAWDQAKQDLIDSGAEKDLDEYLKKYVMGQNISHTAQGAGTTLTLKLADETVQDWINHKAYSKAFWYIGYGGEYQKLYETWIKYHDEVVRKYNDYRDLKRQCYTSAEWLSKNYDVVVLGFAENFGGQDLNVDECDDIKAFVENGGTLLTTHDSTTRYEDAGAVTLTKELRDVFGMDRFHMTQNANGAGTSGDYVDYEPLAGAGDAATPEYYFSSNDFNNFGDNDAYIQHSKVFGPFTPTNRNMVVKIAKDETGTTGDHCYKTYVEEETDPDTGDPVYVPEGDSLKITIKYYASLADLNANATPMEPAYNISDCGLYLAPPTTPGTPVPVKYQGKSSSDGTVLFDEIISTGPPTTDTDDEEEEVVGELPKLPLPEVVDSGQKTYKGVYREFVLKDGYANDGDKYFLTAQSVYDFAKGYPANIGQRALWEEKLSTKLTLGPVSPVGVTDTTAVFETEVATGPYTYAETSAMNNAGWASSIWQDAGIVNQNAGYVGGTDRVSINNKGIVTTYPFELGDELEIAKTHAQTFALDLEDPGMTVWYSLAGCDGKLKKIRSSMYAASPRDGMDSYFLYSRVVGKGFVNYCGAGHSCVTGLAKNNNAERKLYINLIVNAVRNKGSKPIITLHEKVKDENDPEPSFNDEKLKPGKKTKPAIDGSGNYTYNVDKDDEVPEFNYKVMYDKKAELRDVKVFYDLNYGIEAKFVNTYEPGTDVLIYECSRRTDKDLAIVENDKKANRIQFNQAEDNMPASNMIGRMREGLYHPLIQQGTTYVEDTNVDLLKLKPEYFTPYGNYTYIVIWAKDSNGKSSYQRMKIKLKEHLFDLTDASYEIPAYTGFDITDKTKYKI